MISSPRPSSKCTWELGHEQSQNLLDLAAERMCDVVGWTSNNEKKKDEDKDDDVGSKFTRKLFWK
jgi:hypothetical protein